MWKEFYCSSEWLLWSWLGILVISAGSWYQVQLDVQINSWFGDFYDKLQKALSKEGDVSREELNGFIFTFSRIAGTYIVVAVFLTFFTRHWTFRWRQAMNDHYMKHWSQLRLIEGASQRVQEDTKLFARMVEDIGATLLQSVLTLVAFLPILLELSEKVHELPLLGEVPNAMVPPPKLLLFDILGLDGHVNLYTSLVFDSSQRVRTSTTALSAKTIKGWTIPMTNHPWQVKVTIVWALLGSIGLGLIGMRLPGLEFQKQRVEAAFRKDLQLFLQNLKKLKMKSLLLLSVCFVASCNWRSWSMVRMMNVGQKLGWWRISFKRFKTAILRSTSILCILMLPSCSTSNQNPPVALWSSFTTWSERWQSKEEVDGWWSSILLLGVHLEI